MHRDLWFWCIFFLNYNVTKKFRPESKVIIFAENSEKMNETKKVSRRKYTTAVRASRSVPRHVLLHPGK